MGSENFICVEQTHLRDLADGLAAEVGDGTQDAAAPAALNHANFSRLKRPGEFNFDVVPSIQPAYLGRLAAGHCLDAGGPVVLLGDSGTGGSRLLITAQRLGADPHHGVGAPSEPPGWHVRDGVAR